jgi:WhiB family redox-sensing transcriptional regulator
MKVPCDRCGIPRTVNEGGARSNFCRDCKAGYSDTHADREWMADAACAQVDPAIFFPDPAAGWVPTRHALEVCASCPVRALCLADAPAWDRHSIRGGKTATERARARRKAAA